MREREALIEENRELRRLLYSAGLALRSYEFSNSGPNLAEVVADDIAAWLAAHGASDGLLLPPVDDARRRNASGFDRVGHTFIVAARMTPAIRDALGTLGSSTTVSVAKSRIRDDGIEQKLDDETAVVLLWHISLAARHSDGWRDVASEHMRAIGRRSVERRSEVSEGRS